MEFVAGVRVLGGGGAGGGSQIGNRDIAEHNPTGTFIPSVTQHPISTDESRQ